MKSASCSEAERKIRLSKVDQLLRTKLASYNIKLDYEFDLVNNDEAAHQKSKLLSGNCYFTRMENILVEKGIQLKLKFPSRDQFLLSQFFSMFLISALLILAVTISFIVMLRLYIRERSVAQKTKDFVNNMTHELKTPLANIGLANSLAQKQIKPLGNEKLTNYLHIIDTEKRKLQSLADDILTIAVLENGYSCNGFEEVDMHQLISKASQEGNLAIGEKEGIIALDLKAANMFVTGSQSRLTNVLTNLIDNGIKYNMNKPLLNISTQNEGNKLLISVKDNGIGIKGKDLKHIFEKYFRVPTGNVHNAKGFGLGLSFVKLVVDEHGGNVRIRSKVGHGTEVEIELPVK